MKYDVFGMGNALVDIEYQVHDEFFKTNNVEKGLMTLVDEKRQTELLDILKKDKIVQIKKQCGGSAANTVIALSQFGGSSFYACKVADDDFGRFYLEDLKENGIDTKLSLNTLPEGITGKCMVMITPDAERTMNTYLGITSTFSKEELDYQALKNSKWLYIEGYLVASESGNEAITSALSFAREHNIKVAFTMSDPNMVKFFKDNVNSILSHKVDLLFCNELEALEFTQEKNIEDAREKLKQFASHFAITQGKNGAIIWDGHTYIDIEPYKTKAIDSNGAGDMFAGAFLYGVTSGMSYAGAGSLASLAASKIVSQFGPRLKWTDAKEILKEIREE